MNREIKAGSKILFTPTGVEFVLKTVTGSRVSWHNERPNRPYINRMTCTTVTRDKFEKGIKNGTYIIL
jgi:hypothetical protein